MVRALAILVASCLFVSSAMADASTMCVYSLLIGSHAILVNCGEKLTFADAARYKALHDRMRKYIVKNAHRRWDAPADPDGRLSKYEASVESKTANPALCTSPEFSADRRVFWSLMSEKSVAMILKSLATKHDPFDGDCL